MASTKIMSMLLASADPERLRNWYVEALGPDSSEDQGGYRMVSFGGFYLVIDQRDDVGGRNPEPGRMIINFDVDDARATAAKLDELGVEWLAKLEDRDGSLFATAVDPDGNYVQIIQLSEEAKQSMS